MQVPPLSPVSQHHPPLCLLILLENQLLLWRRCAAFCLMALKAICQPHLTAAMARERKGDERVGESVNILIL